MGLFYILVVCTLALTALRFALALVRVGYSSDLSDSSDSNDFSVVFVVLPIWLLDVVCFCR